MAFIMTRIILNSKPEKNFFEQMLNHLKLQPAKVEDIYFTGAISDPQKTDFYVDYFGEDGKWHRYSPDFLIRLKDGKCLIVEIKREDKRNDLTDGEKGRKAMATKKWVDLNPALLKYEMIFTNDDEVAVDEVAKFLPFIKGIAERDMAENKRVEIKPAKGRPMLSWVGKKPLRDVIAYPAQLVETFAPEHAPKTDKNLWKDWTEKFSKGGLLFHGDNKDVLAYLLANGFRGKVKLIYIDPPFDSGADYVRKGDLRGNLNKSPLESESYALGEQIQYSDIWANDNYLQFMYERLLLFKNYSQRTDVYFYIATTLKIII